MYLNPNRRFSPDINYSKTHCSARAKLPCARPPDISKDAAEATGPPIEIAARIVQAKIMNPACVPAPVPAIADSQQPPTQSLKIPPRDHVAPKSYESVTIAVGRNCPQGLRRAVCVSWPQRDPMRLVRHGIAVEDSNWGIATSESLSKHVTDFDLRKLMYNGAISMVYHAVDKRSGITVALKLYKRIKLNEIERHQVAREIRLHSDLAHDSIIALYAAWKDKAYVYLALEWAPGGDVYSYLKSQRGRLAEELAVPLILEPFMAGLAVIHEKGLIHRDIKPENMLLTNSFQVKIADFGLSIDSKQEIANTRLGTIDYLAPEILDCPVKQHPEDHKDRPDTGYTNKVDCWSVGVLAYELLVGQPPFAAPTAQETLRLIRSKRVEYPSWLSTESINFMSIVLVRDPTQRPSIAELLDHPWILKYSRREGGGLARARNRVQQRRPTVDGGVLVRSMTGDLGQQQLSQKHQQFLQQQQQQQHQSHQQQQQQHQQQQQQQQHQQQQQQQKHSQGPAGATQAQSPTSALPPVSDVSIGGGAATPSAANGHPMQTKQLVVTLQNYNHAHNFPPNMNNSMLLTTIPLPVSSDAVMAVAGGTSGSFAITSMSYETSVATAVAQGPSGTSPSTHMSPPRASPPPLPPPPLQQQQQQHPAYGSLLPPASGVRPQGSPEKLGSFSRKLKFWSVMPSGGSASGGGAVPAAVVDATVGVAVSNGGWADASMRGSTSQGGGSSNSSGKVVPLPSPTGGNSSPSLFARLTSGRTKSSVGMSLQAPSMSSSSGPMALLAGLMPGGNNKNLSGGGYDSMNIDSGAGPVSTVGGASSAVPPVTPDAPSQMGLFRQNKMGHLAPP